MESIGKRLSRLRKRAGLSMKQVSEGIGVPVTTYRDWEYGRAIQGNPYIKLSKVLRVPLYELISGQKPEFLRGYEALEAIQGHLDQLRSELLPLL